MEKIVEFYPKETSNYEIVTLSRGHLTNEQLDAYHIRCAESSDEALIRLLQKGCSLLVIGSVSDPVREAAKEYPQSRIVCIEGASDTPAADLLLLKLSRLRAAGATPEEAAAYFARHKADTTLSSPAATDRIPLWSPIPVTA